MTNVSCFLCKIPIKPYLNANDNYVAWCRNTGYLRNNCPASREVGYWDLGYYVGRTKAKATADFILMQAQRYIL